MSEPVRKPKITLYYAGTEVLGSIGDSLINFSFTDNAYDKADDLQITLHDREQTWKGGWMPSLGGLMWASITYENVPLICGLFTVDSMDFSGPPDVVNIKGASAFINSSARKEKKSKSWEETSLKQVADDVAKSQNLDLVYDADDVNFKRLDQRQENDLKFLQRTAQKYGIKVKVSDGKLIVKGLKQFDIQLPVGRLHRGRDDIIRYSLSYSGHNIFKQAKVSYTDPEDRENKTHEFTPPTDKWVEPGVGQTLKVNEKVDSKAQAEKRAEGELREKNKDQTTGNITIVGNTKMYAGFTILLTGFGVKFDGIWLIESARHNVSKSAGYTTDLNIRKTLGW